MHKFFASLDKRYVKVCAYAAATVLLTLGICLLFYFASPVLAKIWALICAVVEPLVYGAALSYVLNPLVKRVSHVLRRYPRYADDGPRRRNAAVLISIALVVLLLLALIAIFVLMITHSLASLNWASIHSLVDAASGDLTQLLATAEKALEDWGFISAESESNLISAFNGVTNTATTLIFAVIFGVYFLIDGPRVAEYLGRVARAVMGHHTVDPSGFFADADRVFSGYFRGQGIDALIVGVLSGIVLTAIGVPFAPVVGLLAGFGNLIPYLGGPVGFGSVALMCLSEAAWGKMIAGFIAMAVIMFVDGNIINPRLLSDNVEVHPILVVAALIAGGAVGGIAGMLVAVPTAALLKLQLDRWVEKREAAEQERDDG